MSAPCCHTPPLQSAAILLRQLALFIALLWTAAVNATTVLRVDVDYLLEHARLIFEGEVIARESQWNARGNSIETLVTFRVVDVIKGDYPQSTIVIRYAGGVVAGSGVAVSAMVYPRLGEHGIYFMENPQRNLVNPMVGWGQGHFIIQPDPNGTQRMHTESGMAVLEIDTPTALGGPPETAAHMQFSHGIAKGVRVGSKASAITSALEKSSFKQRLRQRLSESNARSNQPNKLKQ